MAFAEDNFITGRPSYSTSLYAASRADGMLTFSVGMGAEKPPAKHVEIQHGS